MFTIAFYIVIADVGLGQFGCAVCQFSKQHPVPSDPARRTPLSPSHLQPVSFSKQTEISKWFEIASRKPRRNS